MPFTDDPKVTEQYIREFMALLATDGALYKNTSFTLEKSTTVNNLLNDKITASPPAFPDALTKCIHFNIGYPILQVRISTLMDIYTSIANKSTDDNSTSTGLNQQSVLFGPSNWINDYDTLQIIGGSDQAKVITFLAFLNVLKNGLVNITWPGAAYNANEKPTGYQWVTGIDTNVTGTSVSLLRTTYPYLPDSVNGENVTIGDIVKYVFPNEICELKTVCNYATLQDNLTYTKYCYAIQHDLAESVILSIDVTQNTWLVKFLYESGYFANLLTNSRLESALSKTELVSMKKLLALTNGENINPKYLTLMEELSSKTVQQLQLIAKLSGDSVPRFLFKANWTYSHVGDRASEHQGNLWGGSVQTIPKMNLTPGTDPYTVTGATQM